MMRDMAQIIPGTSTPVRRSALWIGLGVPTAILGTMVLAASVYAALTHATYGAGDTDPSVVLAWFGWILVVAGAGMLGLGAFYLAEHADRAAGFRFGRLVIPRTSDDDELDRTDLVDD